MQELGIQYIDNAALRLAAKNGHLEVLKCLHTTFHLTADDARANDNEALRAAAEWGYLEVMKWLHEVFGLHLTDEDVRANDNEVKRGGYKWENVEVLMFLHETFRFSGDDARADDNYALRHGRFQMEN